VRVQEACEILEISEQRFYQLREELLQAALERLEGKPVGRPRRKQDSADSQALQDKVDPFLRVLPAPGRRQFL